jgi:iron complex outermembrane receptor protein
MTMNKAVWLATTTMIGSLVAAGGAMAQSTGTQEVDALVVTAAGGPRSIEGFITAQTAAKTRSVITQEFISTQAAGQTVAQSLNLVPGLNFTNDDPFGSAGGNIRLHGLDGSHIGLLIDGVPLNDAGNYAIYTNQQLDPELIEQANVNTGSADIDTATASSTGGVINYTTLKTSNDASLLLVPSLGNYDYKRIFGLAQTGSFGPWGSQAWVSASYQNYEKFKGPGDLTKKQINFRINQPIRDNGDFFSLTLNYNENRNTFYYSANLGTATGFCDVAKTQVCIDETKSDPAGWDVDYLDTYVLPSKGPGAQSVPAANSAVRSYYGYRLNPSNTGTIRGSSRYSITDNLRLTVDPSFNYTLANGGGVTAVSETAGPLRGANNAAGVDLNKDGDLSDTVLLYTPSNTNTRRYGLDASLLWTVTPDQRIRFSYAYDYGRTRQTGEYGPVTDSGAPENVFSGKDGYGVPVLAADGRVVQKRDRFSVATLNQFSLEYQGAFFDDKLNVSAGVRAPYLTRDLSQYCYTPVTNTSSVYCTSEVAIAQPNGLFRFASQNTTNYFGPQSKTKKYHDLLPSVGATYKLTSAVQVFGNYTEQQSAPKVDNLYTLTSAGTLGTVKPETSSSFNGGLRYSSPTVVASISAFHTDFHNRIVSTRSQTDDTIIDRNVGNVRTQGVDAEIGLSPTRGLTLYASASYIDAIVTNDIFVSTAAGYAPTKGKTLVETPNWTFGGRVAYQAGPVTLGVQGKWVGSRWVTDVNDLKTPSYTVIDADVRLDVPEVSGMKSYLQVNVTNLLDEKYFASLKGTQTSSTPGTAGYGRPFAAIGGRRAVTVSLHALF